MISSKGIDSIELGHSGNNGEAKAAKMELDTMPCESEGPRQVSSSTPKSPMRKSCIVLSLTVLLVLLKTKNNAEK